MEVQMKERSTITKEIKEGKTCKKRNKKWKETPEKNLHYMEGSKGTHKLEGGKICCRRHTMCKESYNMERDRKCGRRQ